MTKDYDKLGLGSQLIFDEYMDKRPVLDRMKQIVLDRIRQTIRDNHLQVTAIEARVKTPESLVGKLIRKGYKYQSIADITDLMGARIITLFSDDVDRVAALMGNMFDIDWANSTDKRKVHDLDSFGYNSLHYICRIPESLYSDPDCPEINQTSFEIQMRSTLQHAWAAMDHDIGYKSEIETPPEYMRMFGRLAGLLELADEEFSRIRISVADYRRRMETLLQAGELSQVKLDGDTFASYIDQKPFDSLMRRIKAINQAEVREMSFVPYFPLIREMGMETLQDVADFIRDNEEDAYQFALSQLSKTDIDIVASTIGLQDLLIVATLKNGGGRLGVKHIYDVVQGESEHNVALADMALYQASNLPFMTNINNVPTDGEATAPV